MPTRLLSRLACAIMLATAALFLTPSPASAAPTITYENRCGFVLIRVDDVGPAAVEIMRNGRRVATINGSPRPEDRTLELGSASGNVISAETDGDPLGPAHKHQPPNGCSGPAVTIDTDSACNGTLTVRANNTGSAPATGFFAFVADPDERLADLTFPVGASVNPVPATAARQSIYRIARTTPGSESGFVVWFETSAARMTCSPNSVVAQFFDTCDQVKINVAATDPDNFVWAYLVARNLGGADEVVQTNQVDPDTPRTHVIPAQLDDDFAVYLVTGDPSGPSVASTATALPPGLSLTLVADHTHSNSPCGGGAGGDSASDGDSASGGGLPVTGFQVTVAVGAGAALLVTGMVLFLVARRRRIRFVSAG